MEEPKYRTERMDGSSVWDIKRKPVPLPNTKPSSPADFDILDDLIDDYLEPPNPDHEPASSTKSQELRLDTRSSIPPRQLSVPLVSSPSEISVGSSVSTPASEASDPGRSIWKTAVDETIYFAGGLISHPFESTKHYSILRHSHGLVYYRGPSTNVTITVFADAPLPVGRSFWLQRKGFSGNMGMAASALLRTQGNWIDVTPSFEALPSDVPESDERAWQRDIKKFLKKATSHKSLSKHVVRETCIIRVPASASDGYLRVVMCTGEDSKKVICPSPVFRVASTSSDVSIFRGASLKTMPIEVGLKVASVVGTNVANKFIAPATAATAVVQDRVKKLQPGFITQEAGKIAYMKSGLHERIVALEENFDSERDARYDAFHSESNLQSLPDVIGADTGPTNPFPIKFGGKVIKGTGLGQTETGTPTANLAGVPNDLLLRLNGIYIGWALVQSQKGLEAVSHDWHEAIITVGPSPYAAPRIVAKNVTTVHIIHDFGQATFFEANLKVVIMAFLRPLPTPDRTRSPSALAAAVGQDVNIAVASLSRENWQCEMSLMRIKTEASKRTLEERYVDVRAQAQKRVDSVPLHWAGIRTARAELKDQVYGKGGLYIRR
ncbi:hypothetical protein F4779DRAFT_599382 [Xylariaceae sp. FL0662B]|nr:hypothetical protein F4779DRAFT_599382 [Xylariaceae sp. FL0662B]